MVFPDQNWGAETSDYDRRGSLDTLLAYVLGSTNFVAQYQRADKHAQPTVTRVEIIGKLGNSSEVTSEIVYDPGQPEPQADAVIESADAADYAPPDAGADESDSPEVADGTNAPHAKPGPVDRARIVASATARPPTISDLLRSRAQAVPQDGVAPAPAKIPTDQEAQLRELTRRAHADVKALAKALQQTAAETEQQ